MDWDTPPAGVPWPVWLFLTLVGGPAGASLLFTQAAARLPGALGALGRWWQQRRRDKRDEFLQSQAARVDDREIKRLSVRYDELAADAEQDRIRHRAEIAEVRGEVQELRDLLTAANSRLWAAIGYVRILIDSHHKHAPAAQVPTAPDKLQDLI
ncbi:hypothetical protein ACFQNE_02115 [Gordonia phosphorivorans]|uniref:Uncharacterized protein n=1 Tax=Gordonia phosphorivorans TaxID=1056982 RepID=A0ABV6H947_9ACTN